MNWRTPGVVWLFICASCAALTSCTFKHKRVSDYGPLTMDEAALDPWAAVALKAGQPDLAQQVRMLGERPFGQYPSDALITCLRSRVATLESGELVKQQDTGQRHHHIRSWMERSSACSSSCAGLNATAPSADEELARHWGQQCEADFQRGAALELDAPRAILARATSAFEEGQRDVAMTRWFDAEGWLKSMQAAESKRQLRAELDAVKAANQIVFERWNAASRDVELTRLIQLSSRLGLQLSELQRERSASARLLAQQLGAQYDALVAQFLERRKAILEGSIAVAPP